MGKKKKTAKPIETESRTTVFAYYLLLCMAGIWAASHPVSSGDLWVALGCGRYTLSHGVVRNDPFGFTSIPGHWVNQNWLSHVLFTWTERLFGLTGLGVWKVAVCVAITFLAGSTARALGASRFFAALAGIGVAVAGRPFYDVRPNMHTILLGAIFIRWLVSFRDRRLSRSWPLLLVMILWANLHGGFVFGILTIGAATFGLMIEQLRSKKRTSAWPSMLLLPILCIAATIVSPYGLTNLIHPYEVSMGPSAEHWRGVIEWRPPHISEALSVVGVRAFWIIFFAGVVTAVAAIVKRRRLPRFSERLPVITIVFLTLFLAATSRRFTPLFGVAALPLLGAIWTLITRHRPIARPVWIVAAALVTVVGCVDMADRLLRPNPLWPKSQGWAERLVRLDEQPSDATRFVLTSGVGGNLFTDWTWGGYLLYSIPFEDGEPRYKIYIDGRAQAAYPVEVSKDWGNLILAAHAKKTDIVESFFDYYDVDIAVIGRRRLGLASQMQELNGWTVVYGDDRALVAVRDGMVDATSGGVFPDEAIAEASASLRIRTGGITRPEEIEEAFSHALASIHARPTTVGVTEMVRLALGAAPVHRDSLRAIAVDECNRVMAGGLVTGIPYEVVAIETNTAQSCAILLDAMGEKAAAERFRQRAREGTERTSRYSKLYMR